MKTSKITLLSTLLICFSYSITAQVIYDLPRDYMRNSSFNINSLVEGVDYEGSPYLHDEYKMGEILFSDKSITRLLRYNAYGDFFEVKIDENKSQQLSKSEDISMKIGNKLYQVVSLLGDKQYMANLNYKENGVNLMVKKQIKFKEATPATTTYGVDKPAKFYVITEYYLKEDDSITLIKLKKKELLNELTTNQKQLKSFIKENKLNLSKEEDVLKLIKYNNSL